MRTLIAIILSFAIIIIPFTGLAVSLSAQSAVLVDVESGRVLYSKNDAKQMKIASLTKIMTAIIAIENANLESMVKTSKNAFGVEGSSIYLKQNEQMKLHDMLYGLMLRSGNDAATAIAEHVSGSMEKFTELMNDKAKQLGMEGTLFTNSHGLDWGEGNYSTASDMGKLLAYCLRNPVFKEIVSTKVKKVPWEGENYDRVFYNKNKMLSLYPGGDGVKTGYTVKAGRCLAASATKDDWQLATIVLNAPDWWRDSSNLLSYGFHDYIKQQVIETNITLKSIPVIIGKEKSINVHAKKQIYYPIKENEKGLLSYTWELPKSLKAPVEKDQLLGYVIVSFDNKQIAKIPLYSDSAVEKMGVFERLKGFFYD
jgi:D-alanyl-D-alanine carboxypeptidase